MTGQAILKIVTGRSAASLVGREMVSVRTLQRASSVVRVPDGGDVLTGLSACV